MTMIMTTKMITFMTMMMMAMTLIMMIMIMRMMTLMTMTMLELTQEVCPEGWSDFTMAELGCLYFNTSRAVTWQQAVQSCQPGLSGVYPTGTDVVGILEIRTPEVRL